METGTLLWIGGIAIVVIAAGFLIIRKYDNKSKKVVSLPTNGRETEKTPKPPQIGTGFNRIEPAKDGLINNLEVFTPLLKGLDKGEIDASAWKEAIVGTNNYQLLSYWMKIKDKASSWVTILQMWGIKSDSCTSFVGMAPFQNMYVLADGSEIEISKKYRVISPCWILTETTPEGKYSKRVIIKGVVELTKDLL